MKHWKILGGAAGAGALLASGVFVGQSSASVASSNGFDVNTTQYTLSAGTNGKEVFCDANGDTAVGGGIGLEDAASEGAAFKILSSYPAISGGSGSKDSYQAVMKVDSGHTPVVDVYVICKTGS